MRARGWEVTGNEVLADGVVLLTASRDRVEATIRIVQLGNASIITVLVSEITVTRDPRAPEPQVPDPDRVIIRRVPAREPDRLERQPRTRPQVSASGSGSGVRPAGGDTRDDPPRDDEVGAGDHNDPSKPTKGEKDEGEDRPSKPDHQDPDRDKAPKPEKDKSSKDKGERDDRHSPPSHREHDRGKPPKPAKAKHEADVRHVKPSQKRDGGDDSPKHGKSHKHGDED
jgi:hypothetical protein